MRGRKTDRQTETGRKVKTNSNIHKGSWGCFNEIGAFGQRGGRRQNKNWRISKNDKRLFLFFGFVENNEF